MAEHLSEVQLAGYGGRTLDADELLAVDRHLALCDVCHERLTRMSPHASDQPSNERSIEEPFHLDYDQHLAAYVDGKSNDIDREIVESHVALCSDCAEDLRDLQEFRQQPAYVPVPEDRKEKSSSWKGWMGQWQWPRVWNPQFTAALVIAVFILGITLAVVLWTTKRTERPVQQAGPAATPEVNKQTKSASPEPTADKVATQPSPEQQNARAAQPKPEREGPLIALNDGGGGQITLDRSGHLAGLESLPPELKKNVETVLTTRQFHVPPALGNLSESTGRLRGTPENQNILVPLQPTGVVIESDRPTFRWRALEGVSDYLVTIYDSKLRSVDSSGPLVGTEWTISRPLERGVTYSWQIRAVKDGKTVIAPKPPAPEARFRVLNRKAVAALKNAKRVHGSSHLAMGVFYWKQGLIDEAEREFEALVRGNPESPIAVELLRSLRSLRRR
jgi:hypothetical protein